MRHFLRHWSLAAGVIRLTPKRNGRAMNAPHLWTSWRRQPPIGRRCLPVHHPYAIRASGSTVISAARAGGSHGRWQRPMSEAMQLTNIVRDIRQDYALGRVHLPEEDLSACGLKREDLGGARVTPRMRAAVRIQVQRARLLLSAALRRATGDSTGGGRRLSGSRRLVIWCFGPA
ncbi:squalene/phytoene synthase family protein [Kitasatospora sp. NPDC008050]|uniref:squalene/phytoene synthase family protein n=1 Tax=Kitasatospora sp. NPDC008050 TaxID=3364021 RepID=UPI0036EC3C5E